MSSWGGDIDNGDEDDVIVVYFFSVQTIGKKKDSDGREENKQTERV